MARQPLELRHERLLAAATLLRSALCGLDDCRSGFGQGYHLELLVERVRILVRVADEVSKESAGSSGSTLPA